MDEQNEKPPVKLAPGEMWVDSGASMPSRDQMRKIKADLKALLRADGHEVENHLNVHYDKEAGRQRLHVSAEMAPAAHAVLSKLKETYPELRAVVEAEPVLDVPVALPMGEPVNAEFRDIKPSEATDKSEGPAKENPAKAALNNKEFMMKGGASLGAAALGGIAYHRGKEKSEGKKESAQKGKLLKAVGVALAIAVPAILLGKDVLAKTQGIGR